MRHVILHSAMKALWMWNTVLQIQCYILIDSYHIQLKDNDHHKIDEAIGDSGYDIIGRDQLKSYKIYDKERQTRGLSHGQELLTKSIILRKRVTVKTDEVQYNNKETRQYNYDYLVNEYYAESINEAESNKSYHANESDSSGTDLLHSLKKLFSIDAKSHNCIGTNDICLNGIKCLINDYKTDRLSSKALAMRFCKITKTWLIVYLAVAIPLWCTRGWCCCFLFCKFFKPQQTIDEAKKYLMQNPPGKLKSKSKELRYCPTDKEKERYEEFEHLIKII